MTHKHTITETHRAVELAAADPGSPAASAAVERGESLLVLAARYWRSKESLAESGALQSSCGELARLGRAEGFVKVCLACAANFAPTGEQLTLLLTVLYY
jgi:hypothetical protein